MTSKRQRTPKTPIRKALRASSHLNELVADGIQAVERSHRALLSDDLKAQLADSLEIDENLKANRDRENRWDYILGHAPSGQIIGLEPHTAGNHEIDVVIKKRARALEALREHLKDNVRPSAWFWVASGRVGFLPMDKAITRCAQHGIKFVGRTLALKHLVE